jgi:hypothetical protein
MNSLDFYQSQYIEKIDSALETKFGKDFFNILKSDFGLSKFADIRTKIFSDFRTSVTYYLENRYYTLGDGTYGKPSEIRFEDCERYDFDFILGDIESILINCIDINLSFLKRRTVDIKKIPREFKTIIFDKNIKDTIDRLGEPVKDIKVVFDGEKVIMELDILGEPPGGLGGGVPPDKFDLPVEPIIPIKVNPIEIGQTPEPKDIIPIRPKLLPIKDLPPKVDILPINILPPPPKLDDIIDILGEPPGGLGGGFVEPIKEVPPQGGSGPGVVNYDPRDSGFNNGFGTNFNNPKDIGVRPNENME